ncbi:ammonium transporter [uncultured Bilophila sp.]|uniref:ammonium transporter n=1 Tax=uncultured Bilophila sp. TaxID=529385 RepID=UPI0025928CA0|nr:ammonium transporter [uncultured Bilophila sp.]
MYSATDVIWVLVSAVLVFFMQAGFALCEAGLTRAKNTGNILMKNMMDFCIGVPCFWLIGFGIMFAGSGSFIGGFDPLIRGSYDFGTLPTWCYAIFQTVFCATAATIVSGSMAERTNFKAYCIYSAAISLVVYPISGHWIWGGGFLAKIGVMDFAGGIVIHVSAGFAALASVIFLGRRDDMKPGEPTVPNNLPLVAVGAGLLWFGWFGFNAGGAYAADGLAAYAFTNTTIAGSIAMIVWMLYDWHYDRKPSFSGVLVGAVAGLATITPCAGYVEPWAAIIIGAVGSSVCYYAKYVQERLGFDDALEVWRAHGMGGVTGALLLGILASSNIDKVNASIHQFLMQLLGVIIVAVYSFVVTIIIFKVISAWGPIRVTKEEEEAGLDESLHGEEAYKM